ncbi:MAG: ABC transporter permease [Calditrichaeota bacterium]|nr:ABC transporter permease [Calditrichota bacterium]
MNKTLSSIIKKEFRHILRDKQTLIIIFLMPVMMLILFGYAINLEMQNIKTAIVDNSKTPQSRDFIEKIISVNFFRIVSVDPDYNNLESLFQMRQANCIVVIPYDFARKLDHQPQTKVQLLIDASDPNAANYINNYLNMVANLYNLDHNDFVIQPLSVEPRLLYNPDMKSAYFFVPGLIAVIILLICALLTSIAIVREKENGTLEQILVSPVKPIHIIIGKVLPYMMIGFLMGLMILVIGHFWFGVPVAGSVVLLNLMMILYVVTGLSFGLLISTITKSQQIAMMATLVVTILPTIMLSGFIFPIASMPLPLQFVSRLIPATHFLEIIRSIMLKGVGIAELYKQAGALALISLVLLGVSMKKFSTHLE